MLGSTGIIHTIIGLCLSVLWRKAVCRRMRTDGIWQQRPPFASVEVFHFTDGFSRGSTVCVRAYVAKEWMELCSVPLVPLERAFTTNIACSVQPARERRDGRCQAVAVIEPIYQRKPVHLLTYMPKIYLRTTIDYNHFRRRMGRVSLDRRQGDRTDLHRISFLWQLRRNLVSYGIRLIRVFTPRL